MFTVLATSWTLFSGPTNYIALSTAAFFGIGMYVVGAGLPYMPFPVLVVLAAVAGALLAAVVGLATLRISGVYFVIFTLGLAELVRQIVAWAQHVMGTSSGLYVLISISDSVMYWLLLGLAAMVYLVGWFIGRSRLGFALRIIGNDEVVAVHCGINTARAKVILFVISCTFAVHHWRAGGAALELRRTVDCVQPVPVVRGRDHGAAGRRPPLWGPLVGVIPFTLLWEFISAKFPDADHDLAGRLLSPHRLFHSARRGRAARRPDARPRRRVGLSRRVCFSAGRPTMPDGSLGAAVLRIEGVTKRFGGLVAVDNMSFELSKNEVLGLIGPNGSGKTTMLNMISGALKPTAGADPAPRQGHFDCAGKRDRRPGHRPHVSDRSHAAVADGAGERRRRRRVRPQPALGSRARRLRPRPAAAGWLARRRRRLGRGAHLYRSETGRARPRARVRSRSRCCSTSGSPV